MVLQMVNFSVQLMKLSQKIHQSEHLLIADDASRKVSHQKSQIYPLVTVNVGQ